MTKKILCNIVVLVLATLACTTVTGGISRVVGSGHLTAEPRNVTNFSSVELAGSADVSILLGNAESVSVQADDNILPLIETVVDNGTLVIRTKPLTNISPSNRVVVTIAMKSLKAVRVSGSGNMNVGAMFGPDLRIDLPGSGEITVEGAVDHLTVDVAGSGRVTCDQLKARSVNAALSGSGNINVNASEALDASISGSGAIRYEGNPARVTKSITGSGTISP